MGEKSPAKIVTAKVVNRATEEQAYALEHTHDINHMAPSARVHGYFLILGDGRSHSVTKEEYEQIEVGDEFSYQEQAFDPNSCLLAVFGVMLVLIAMIVCILILFPRV